MNEITVNNFRDNLKSEVDKVVREYRALRVKRRNGDDFVVLGTEDWSAIEETIYLNQMPGLVNSIHRAAKKPQEEGTPLEKLRWSAVRHEMDSHPEPTGSQGREKAGASRT